MTVLPVLGRLAVQLAGRRHPKCVLDVAIGVRIRGGRLPVRAKPEPIGTWAGKHAELVVVGMVLHHQHDDVLDLRDSVRAGRPVWVGKRARLTTDHWRCRVRASGLSHCALRPRGSVWSRSMPNKAIAV